MSRKEEVAWGPVEWADWLDAYGHNTMLGVSDAPKVAAHLRESAALREEVDRLARAKETDAAEAANLLAHLGEWPFEIGSDNVGWGLRPGVKDIRDLTEAQLFAIGRVPATLALVVQQSGTIAALREERDEALLAVDRWKAVASTGAIQHATCREERDALAAALREIAEHGGKNHRALGIVRCNGAWCAEQARTALEHR